MEGDFYIKVKEVGTAFTEQIIDMRSLKCYTFNVNKIAF